MFIYSTNITETFETLTNALFGRRFYEVVQDVMNRSFVLKKRHNLDSKQHLLQRHPLDFWDGKWAEVMIKTKMGVKMKAEA